MSRSQCKIAYVKEPYQSYEYARASEEIVKRVSNFQEQVQREPHADNISGFSYCCGISLYLSCVLWPLRTFFPSYPWLKIPNRKRCSIGFANSIAHYDPLDWENQARAGRGADCAGDANQLIQLKHRNGELVEVYQSHEDHLEGESGALIEQQRRKGYRSSSEQRDAEAALAKPVPVTYFVHRVNWNKADPALVEEFAEWLRRWRDTPPLEKRGQPSPRERLKALAAKRWLDAAAWSDAERKALKADGNPLYSDQRAWIRAKRNAVDYLAQFTRMHAPSPAGRK